MNNFNEYWEKNKDKYIDIVKQQALKDFQLLESKNLYTVIVNIDTDDDFSLDCGESIVVHGESKKEAIKDMIEKLRTAQFTRVNGNHASSWYYIRDEAIKSLKSGQESFTFGGNQVIEVRVFENKTTLNQENIVNKKRNKP